jgi:hypothetical protein
MSLIEDEGMTLDNMQEAKPAPKKEQIKGSDENKPGSASGAGGNIKISAATETALSNKVKEHNDKMKEDDKPAYTRTTLGQLKAVYRRGAGAYSSSHRPGQTRGAWAMARVNAYLYLLRNEKPENPKYITDYDLLPKEHPKSTRDNNAVLNKDTTEVKLVDKNLQEQVDFAVEDAVLDSVVEKESTSAETNESVAEVSTDMKWDEDGNKVMEEHGDEDMPENEDMPDEKDMLDDKEDMGYPKDDEDMMGHPDKEEDKMAKDEEPMEMKGHDTEKEMSTVILAAEIEEDNDAEEAKEDSNSSFTESERAELERFRQEEKQKILESYKKFLSEEVYASFLEGLVGYGKESLETELKLKVADYFLEKAHKEAQAAEEAKAEETGFKTLQVIGQLRESKANDLAKLVEKYKK